MFAQIYHPSMKYAAAPRKELGFRTVFNLLGPLTNPAGADRQLLGVYDRTKTDLMAKVLNQLGVVKALVVSSYDGLDEISVSASTKITQLDNGSITTFDISPEDLGLRSYDVSELMGGDAYVNAEIIRNVLSGAHGAHRDVVLANAGACFYISGIASTLKEGIQHAIRAIDTGAAAETLSKLVSTTKEFSHVS
jgi:anthranilate phosphoribosyltransferase